MGRKTSIRQKVFYIALLLSSLSTILSLIVNISIGYSIVAEKDIEINEMLLSASQEKVNLTLLGINDIILQLQRSKDLAILSGKESDEAYEATRAMREYRELMNDILVLHPEIEAIIVNTGDISFFETNIPLTNDEASKYFLRYRDETFNQSVESMVSEGFVGNFYLDIGENPENENKIIIANPIIDNRTNEITSSIVVLLSDDFVEQFRYAIEGYIIRDELGNSIDLFSKTKVDLDTNLKKDYLIRPLLFNDWSLIQLSPYITVIEYLKNYYWIILISLFVFALTLPLSAFIAKKLVFSLTDMKHQIDGMVHKEHLTEEITLSDRKIKFKAALMLFFISMAIIPAIYIGSMSIAANNNMLMYKMDNVFQKNIDIVAAEFSFIFSQYEKKMFEIALNEEIQGVFQLANEEGNREEDITSKSDRVLLSNFLFHSNITDVAFFDREKKFFYSSGLFKEYYASSDFIETAGFLANNFGDYLWQWTETSKLNTQKMRIGTPVLNIMPQTEQYGKILGYMLLDFNTELITEMFYSLTANSAAMVLKDRNNQSMIISAPLGFDLENISEDKTLENYLFESRYLDLVNMTLDVYLPIEKYKEDLNKVFSYTIFVIFLLIIIGGICAILFYIVMCRKIFILGNVVREIQNKNTDVRYPIIGHDEIDELGNSFNEMLENLHEVMDEKVALQIKSKELELNLLQSQINPHFLYNTLRSVQYMASKGDTRAADVIKKLIFLFRTSTPGVDDTDLLRNELKRVQYYIEIQQLRFSNKFSASFDVDESLLDSRILKLSIQPVVENSIYHGLETKEGTGHIGISVKRESQHMVIIVTDDGLGISGENIKKIEKQLAGELRTTSIGLMNVHGRIQLHYGTEFGLKISSDMNKGTEVRVRLPLIK